MFTGVQNRNNNKPQLSVNIKSHKTFKDVDKGLFERFYLGYPFCLDKCGNYLADEKKLIEAIKEIKEMGKEVYIATMPVMQSKEFEIINELISSVVDYGLDGVEINDVGMFDALKAWPHLRITAGFFMNIYHLEAALEYINEGATTVLLNTELMRSELAQIANKISADVEINVYGNIALGYAYDCYFKKNNAENKCLQQCTKDYTFADKEVRMRNIGKANITDAKFCLIEQFEELKTIAANYLRLDMHQAGAQEINKVGRIFNNLINERIGVDDIDLSELSDGKFCNGWFYGKSGNQFVREKGKVCV